MTTRTYVGSPGELGAPADRLETIYVRPRDRYVVSLIVSYRDNAADALDELPVIDCPRAAAYWAHRLTVDEDSSDTIWCVYDRETQEVTLLEQGELG